MSFKFINPESLGKPKGYANGVLAEGGKLLFIAGQIAWNEKQEMPLVLNPGLTACPGQGENGASNAQIPEQCQSVPHEQTDQNGRRTEIHTGPEIGVDRTQDRAE